MRYLITGGAGFIGSALVRYLVSKTQHQVLVVDKLTYAGNTHSLDAVQKNCNFSFKQLDICNADDMSGVFNDFQPDVVMHLAAESHVDRSINSPDSFIQTNIVGTYILLETSRNYFKSLSEVRASKFRFHHISTDEVYGDLESDGTCFSENTRYEPSSPYAASKASSDHLVRAWHRTYGLPVVITNCSNNYGPYQYPDKLVPLTIKNAIEHREISLYGDGLQVRDWLYVDDHVRALYLVSQRGAIGETYNIGGHNEKNNRTLVLEICKILDGILPSSGGLLYSDQIRYVSDRWGHDRRYAVDASKIADKLGWLPQETFETGILKTVLWYVEQLEIKLCVI